MANEMKTQATVERDAAQPVVDGKKVLLRLRDVKQYFPVKKTKLREKQRYVRANDGMVIYNRGMASAKPAKNHPAAKLQPPQRERIPCFMRFCSQPARNPAQHSDTM